MEKRSLNLKDSAIALILAFIASQMLIIMGELIISAILATFNYSSLQIINFFNSASGYLCTSLFQLFAFTGVYFYYCKKTNLKQKSFAQKLNLKQTVIFITLGLITCFALTNFINYYCLTLNLFNKPSATFSYKLDDISDYLISLISLAVIPAIGEELIFRGVIFNSLRQKGTLFAVIISSLFFTLFHFNISQLFYPFLFGLILGFMYSKTNNLITTILIHFINNAINISIQYFLGTTLFKPTTLNLIIMIIGVIIFIGILAYMFYLSYKQETIENNTKEGEEQKKVLQNKSKTFKNLFTRDNILFWAPIIFMIFIYICLV